MNKMLIAIFDNQTAADAGLQALRALHTAGDITLYATGVLMKDAAGAISVKKPLDSSAAGTVTGLAVGGMIGLLGGPVGLAIGAATGTLAGAVRDFWVAGVGLDFIEQAEKQLLPGKVALVAEIEEEWIVPVDVALEAAGGRVMRRSRNELAEARFDHDIVALQGEIKSLESEASHASGAARTRLQSTLAAVRVDLDAAVRRAQQRVDTLREEADAKAESLKLQLTLAKADARDRIEDRVKRVKEGYHARGAKLARAWALTKDALGA